MSAIRVLLVEIEVTSPAGAVSTLRFCDRAIPPMPPTDALRPNVGFDSRVQEAPSWRRVLFDDRETLAPGLGVGVLTLVNADRALNAYEGHAWGAISVWLWTLGTPSASAQLVIRGVCEQPAFPSGGERAGVVRVALSDYAREASKPLQPALYAGSNGDPGVLYEGTAEGLKGTPKPLAFGDLTEAHIPAPQVNPAEQAHQLHDGVIQGEVALFDRGDDFGLTLDGDLAGEAFDLAAPDPTHAVTDIGRGLVKFNAAPVGAFTAGFKGEAGEAGYVETAGPILARLLARAGVPAGRIGASFATLASAAVMGFWAGEPIQLSEALAFVAAGAPAAVLPDRAGVWQAVAYGPPKADADYVIAASDILDCSSDDAAEPPIGEVRVGWGRIWRTFAGTELAPDLAATDAKSRLEKDYRWAVAEDAVVKARFPDRARTIEIRTALRQEADALALAAALRDLLGLKFDGRPRRAWRLTVPVELALAHQLGETAQVTYPAEGLAGNFLVIGEEPLRPSRNLAVLTVWG